MSPLTVIGTGQIGKALVRTAGRSKVQNISGRDLIGRTGLIQDNALIVHATGPAGEQASKEDPGRAFGMHYTLVMELVEWLGNHEDARLILLGSVAPNLGFYGPLKRAGVRAAQDQSRILNASHRLLVIECGHVIGEGLNISSPVAGVVARFMRAAVEGGRLIIAGHGEQTIRYTPLEVLIDLILAVGRNWPKVPVVSPVSSPVRVIDVARTCLRLSNLAFGIDKGVIIHSALPSAPSYEDPTGESFAVPDLTDVIFQWMRTMEVKLLLR